MSDQEPENKKCTCRQILEKLSSDSPNLWEYSLSTMVDYFATTLTRKASFSQPGYGISLSFPPALGPDDLVTEWNEDGETGLMLPPRIDIRTHVIRVNYDMSLSGMLKHYGYPCSDNRDAFLRKENFPCSGGEGLREFKVYLLNFRHYCLPFVPKEPNYELNVPCWVKIIETINRMGLEDCGLWEILALGALGPGLVSAQPVVAAGAERVNKTQAYLSKVPMLEDIGQRGLPCVSNFSSILRTRRESLHDIWFLTKKKEVK